jgi:hypothetical protein
VLCTLQVLAALHTRYEYAEATYVWPRVDELRRSTTQSPPPAHMAVAQQLVAGYSGFCNFNYKLRDAGGTAAGDASAADTLAIFEMNARVGGDVVNDAPKALARAFLERVNASAAAAL